MNSAFRLGETCGKIFCSCIVAAVIILALVSITTVITVTSESSVGDMFKLLFSG